MEYQTKAGLGLIMVFIGMGLSYFGVYLKILTIPFMGFGAFIILKNVKLMLEENEVNQK